MICLRTSNLSEGGWNWADRRFVSDAEFVERSKRGVIEPGDIVLSREGTVGVAAIVEKGMTVCMGQRLVQVRADSKVLVPEYLLRHLLYVLAPERIGQLMVGPTSQHLNVKDLRVLRVPLPPLDLQSVFAGRIRVTGQLKAAHRTALARLDELFVSLQYRAFRGELTETETALRTAEAPRTAYFEGLRKLEAGAGIEALIFVIKRTPGHDLYASLKTLYVADKIHLERHGQLIYGETYNALPMGPVPKAAYLAVKVLRNEEMFSLFDDAATRAAMKVQGKQLIPLRDADLSKLDSAAIQSLESAIRYFAGATFGEVKAATHDTAYLRTQPNVPIPMQYLIDMLPAKVRQQHWGDEASGVF